MRLGRRVYVSGVLGKGCNWLGVGQERGRKTFSVHRCEIGYQRIPAKLSTVRNVVRTRTDSLYEDLMQSPVERLGNILVCKQRM